MGPLHPDLKKAVEARIAALRNAGSGPGQVPVDLVTASGSGLDPHISPASAEFQVQRIAASRKMSADEVRDLVRAHTESRQFGIFGEARVNVLQLNLALDRQRNAPK
jgi:K+-transporting ATPase ATPase C chain